MRSDCGRRRVFDGGGKGVEVGFAGSASKEGQGMRWGAISVMRSCGSGTDTDLAIFFDGPEFGTSVLRVAGEGLFKLR